MANLEEFILKLRDDFTSKMKDAENSTNSLRDTFGGLGGLIGRITAGIGIASLTHEIISLGIEAEQTRTSFAVMLGGVDNANNMLGELAEFANVTPFDNAGVERAAQTLLQFGIEGNQIIPTLQKLGDASGGNAERLQSMALVFGQISSAGKLSGQDLMQLINNGFNPLKIISEKTGRSMGDLKKDMENGAISADMVTQAFTWATSEGGLFYGMMDKQSKTVGGRISTLLGTLQELGKQIGESLNPILGVMVDSLQSIVGFISTYKTELSVLIGVVAAATTGYFAYTTIMSAGTLATTLFSGAMSVLNVVMSLNPVGLLIAGIAALVAGVYLAYQHFDKFRAAIHGVGEAIKTFVGNAVAKFKALPTIIIEAFKGIPKAMFDTLKGAGNIIGALVSGNFSEVPDLLKQLGADILKTNPLSAVAVGMTKDLTNGVAGAFNSAYDSELKTALSKTTKKNSGKVEPGTTLTGAIPGMAVGSSGGKTGVGSGLSEIKSAAPKNFTININKLVETLSFQTSNLPESKTIIRDEITKILLGAVNDSQIISTE